MQQLEKNNRIKCIIDVFPLMTRIMSHIYNGYKHFNSRQPAVKALNNASL